MIPLHFANWILFFPIACALGIGLTTMGRGTERVNKGWVSLMLGTSVRMLFLLAFLGLVTRATALQFFWIIVAIGVFISFMFWERELAKRSLLLIATTSVHSPERMVALTNYLIHHAQGIWYRRGLTLHQAFSSTQDWPLALAQTRLASNTNSQLGLSILRFSGNSTLLEEELTQGETERVERSRMLGRIAACGSTLLVAPVYSLMTVFIFPTLLRMLEEFALSDSPSARILYDIGSYSSLIAVWPIALFAVGCTVIALCWFPAILRAQPFEWFFHRYYRGLILKGLAEVCRTTPNFVDALAVVGKASPVPVWSRRLFASEKFLNQGTTTAKALSQSRLLTESEAAVVASAERSGSLPIVLRELGVSGIERTFRGYSTLVQLFVIAIILATGLLVLGPCYALISSLTSLVENLA